MSQHFVSFKQSNFGWIWAVGETKTNASRLRSGSGLMSDKDLISNVFKEKLKNFEQFSTVVKSQLVIDLILLRRHLRRWDSFQASFWRERTNCQWLPGLNHAHPYVSGKWWWKCCRMRLRDLENTGEKMQTQYRFWVSYPVTEGGEYSFSRACGLDTVLTWWVMAELTSSRVAWALGVECLSCVESCWVLLSSTMSRWVAHQDQEADHSS